MSDETPISRIPEPEDLDGLLKALGDSRSQDDTERPRLRRAAERRAARLGTTVNQVLTEDRLRLRRSNYPGPECLEPYEVERYLERTLPSSRAAHMEQCPACTALVHAAMPTESGIRELLEEVRRTGKDLAQAASAVAPEMSQPRLRLMQRLQSWLPHPSFGFLTDALAATVPVFIAVSGVFLVYSFSRPVDRPLTAWLQPLRLAVVDVPSANNLAVALMSVVVILTILFLVAAAAWFISTLVSQGGVVFRRSGGALVAGIVLALGASSYMWLDLAHGTRQTQVELRLVQERLGEVVAASLNAKQTSGKFPVVNPNPGLVALVTSYQDAESASYTASAMGIPGTLVADVSQYGGSVSWRSAEEEGTRVVASLEVGTVSAVQKGTLELRDATGERRTIKIPNGWPLPKQGEHVLAVVDAKTRMAMSIHQVDAAVVSGIKK